MQLGLEYSENNGYGASIGYGFDDSDFGGKLNGLSLKYGETQRGGNTYSASLGGKNVPATLNYSLNVNGGVRTNTFGVSIQLPGTEDFSNVVAGINYNDHSGFSSDVSYTFGKSKDSRTPEQRKADAARYNLLDEIFSGVGAMIGGIGRGVKSVWDGMFGGGLSDAEREYLVREQRFKDYAETYMDNGDEIAGPYGRQRDKQLQAGMDKIHNELYPTDDGPGAYVADGFFKPLADALKKMLSWSVKTGLDAMANVQEVTGKVSDVQESLQITKPIVEDTIQLLYKEMDAQKRDWQAKDQAIYDQITDLQSGEEGSNVTDKINKLEKDRVGLKRELALTLDSLDSKAGALISLASDLNAGKTTNLMGAYSQIYEGIMRVNSPELSAKSQSVLNLANSTQAFLISYFNYKMTGAAATVNETGSAWAFQNAAERQKQNLRDLWNSYMRNSTKNQKTPYVNNNY